jgi:hypothetical protein
MLQRGSGNFQVTKSKSCSDCHVGVGPGDPDHTLGLSERNVSEEPGSEVDRRMLDDMDE